MPTKNKTKKSTAKTEADGSFLLKVVLYAILGSLWLKFSQPIDLGSFSLRGLPVGLVVGLIFASHDHFQVDRKLEYVILIIMTVLSFFVSSGIVI
ncbi:MAG TPA: hypothetical protein VFG56_00555 [Candidatus Saccharimonadales bacterium]|nr:hypothetical protein [Candidatus Saccharimonadales bacterium]